MYSHNIKAISEYLVKRLQPVKFTFDKKYITKHNYNIAISNSLFEMIIFSKNNEYELSILHKDTECTFIANHLVPNTTNIFKVQQDGDRLNIITNGLIPTRWFYMINDFYWKDSTVELLPFINDSEQETEERTFFMINDFLWKDSKVVLVLETIAANYFEKELSKIPNNTLNRIIQNSKKMEHEKYNFSVINEKFQTENGYFSEMAQKVLDSCVKYNSLKNSSSSGKPYDVLFACEGGIYITNDFINDYIKYKLATTPYHGSVRNEVKGLNTYQTGKNITHEELLCLYLALRDQNIELKQNQYFGDFTEEKNKLYKY